MTTISEKQDVSAAQQAAPVTHPSHPPAMSAPPVYNETATPRRITPLRQLQREAGPEPEWVNCPFCKQTTTIRRVSEPSDEAKCCLVCCGFLGLLFTCLPGKGEWWENIDIHCTSCDKHIATIPPDEEIQLVRVSDRPPLPTQKKQQQGTTSLAAQKK
ncbi:hypothetical protein EV127DRAFT_483691 [Xylaria flabelliformis]|nr:hypothetical protein EV127DRAFT_483691 [Xylaria flabelliformis]